MKFSLRLDNEEATKRFGEDLALALKKGDLVTLQGDLGAGKSTLARALIRTLACDDDLDVPSPTFTLVQNYPDQRLPVAHADLYRIFSPEETDELGFEQALEDGVLVVEWPEKAEDFMPQAQFALVLSHDGDGRMISGTIEGEAGKRLYRSLFIRAFLHKNRRGRARRFYLAGDASPRGYETITLHGKTELLMDAPQMELPETGAKNYAKTAHLAPDMAQFVGVDRMLLTAGFAAPQIYGGDLRAGLLIMEDLGREGVLDRAGMPIGERYLAAASLLADFHRVDWPNHCEWDDLTVDIPDYDREAMHIETTLLLDWYLPFIAQSKPTADMYARYHEIWDALFDELETVPLTLVMRDFHSPNLIWRNEKSGHDRLGLIDFQDALIGPPAYDLASLGQDARVTVSSELEDAIIETYCNAMAAADPFFERKKFLQSYAIMGAQRVSKILGIFVRLDQRDGKPHYLKHLPRLIDYLLRNLKHPVLQPLKSFYRELGIIL